jgi:hypothetical protein
MSFIYLYLFEHRCRVHCLNVNVICLFVLFSHRCCMSICVVYTTKSCTQLPCLNSAWHSCLYYTNSWNNRFCIDLEWTHEAYKFMMLGNISWEICFLRGKTTREHTCKIRCLNQTFSKKLQLQLIFHD